MADEKSIELRATLKSLFSDSWLREAARDTGFIKRERKICCVSFFWTLVLGFGVDSLRTISGLRRAYERVTRVTIVPSAFYDRFTRSLVRFLRVSIDHVIDEFRTTWAGAHERLERFSDVVLADATVINLHHALRKVFPGSRTNSAPAAAKLHAVFSVLGKGDSTVSITSERVSEQKKLRIGPWVAGRLLLFDLGYFRFQLFSCISRNKGYFLSRLKKNANPRIVKVHRRVRGNSIRVEGQKLQDVLARLERQVLDVEIETQFKNRVYNGKRRTARQRFRLIAILDEFTLEYHCYVTNVPVDMLAAEDIGNTYRARWEIELIFKELKSGYRMDQITSSRKAVAESMIYAAVLTLLVSRKLFRSVCNALGDLASRATAGRWSRLLSSYAQELQLLVIRPPREARFLRGLFETIVYEVVDPHTNRRPLILQSER